MKLLLPFVIIAVLAFLPGTSPAEISPAGVPGTCAIRVYDYYSDHGVLDGLFSAAQDTSILAQYEFDAGGTCAAGGWTGVDLTAQIDTLMHVDTFRAISGLQSLWCGMRSAAADPWCGYGTLPGYGDNWDQYLQSRTFHPEGDVDIQFAIAYDSEPDLDITSFEWSADGGAYWQTSRTFSGAGEAVVDIHIPAADSLQFRFHFVSDEAWSDEDGRWDSEGACILDDIVITDASGPLASEDWENETAGATQSTDGIWQAFPAAGFGDYAGLFPGVTLLQEDVCTGDLSCLWSFISGSTDDYSCALPSPRPAQVAVPYGNEAGRYLMNEIWSPWIDLNPGGAVPATASWVTLDYYEYRDRGLDYLLFLAWHVRSRSGADGCAGPWRDDRTLYYGSGHDWVWMQQELGALIDAGATQIQVALGCWDMAGYWSGIYGSGDCHGHSPLIDHVRIRRIDVRGPAWSVRDVDLFQDSFPADGSLTGNVRIDAAVDRMPAGSPAIYPGDSLVVTVSQLSLGLGTDPANGRAAVYCYVKSTGVNEPAAMIDDPRFEYRGGPTGAGYYQFQMDSVYSDGTRSHAIPNQFCFDLNDSYFTPPDRIDFYFAATDAYGWVSYWTRDTGTTTDRSQVEKYPMEVQCLPTGQSEYLYVDNYDGGGAERSFETAFELLGFAPDRYDVRGPSSFAGNGLGARTTAGQLVDVYRGIIWNAGDLTAGTIGDGSGRPEKSSDARILYSFLDQSSHWNPGLYLSGDNIASEMKRLGTPAFQDLSTFIDYDLISSDHVRAGHSIAPLIIGGLPGSIFQSSIAPLSFDTLVAVGGCPGINSFDVLSPRAESLIGMYYQPTPSHGAVITQETVNAQGSIARVVLSGFSLHYIRDDRPQFPFDRLQHLMRIISWFEQTAEGPFPPDVTITLFEVHQAAPYVQVQWNVNYPEAVTGFQILRHNSSSVDTLPTPHTLLAADVREYIDTGIVPGKTYSYMLRVQTANGSRYSRLVTVVADFSTTTLLPNYPNPFSLETTIPFTLAGDTPVELTVYDALGREVATLVTRTLAKGPYATPWDGTNTHGDPVQSGVYFYRLKAGARVATKKMVLIR